MQFELLQEIIEKHKDNSSHKTEKLHYIKKLESIKSSLRSQVTQVAQEQFGQWFLNEKDNSFSTTQSICHLFEENIDSLQQYILTFNQDQQEKITHLFRSLKNGDKEQLSLTRTITINGEKYKTQERITYLASFNLYVGAVQDLTKVEKIVQNINNIDRSIYNLMEVFDKNIILIKCDINGKIHYVSSAFYESSSCDSNEMIGLNIKEFQHEDSPVKLHAVFERILKLEKSLKIDLKLINKSKKVFWTNAFITAIFENETPYFTLVCQDITNLKLLEDMTNHDALTGAYNRRYYSKIIPKEINRARREGKGSISLLL